MGWNHQLDDHSKELSNEQKPGWLSYIGGMTSYPVMWGLIYDKPLHPRNFNIAPENGWLEDESSFFGIAYFQVRTVSFRVGIINHYKDPYEPTSTDRCFFASKRPPICHHLGKEKQPLAEGRFSMFGICLLGNGYIIPWSVSILRSMIFPNFPRWDSC